MAKTVNKHKAKFDIPFLEGVLPIKGSQFPAEIIAGLTLAALAIPEVMGYTKIAGMPVITGLYTILIPSFLYAIFCSSRHLVVGGRARLPRGSSGAARGFAGLRPRRLDGLRPTYPGQRKHLCLHSGG